MEKRLTRDVNNKKIAGVCAGIANYFVLFFAVQQVQVSWLT